MSKSVAEANRTAGAIGILAGVLMILAGASGATAWSHILSFLEARLGSSAPINMLAIVIVVIASLGGLAVIIGSALIASNHVRGGRLLMALGAGIGVIGLILFTIVSLEKQELPFVTGIGLGALGLILSIVARFKSRLP